MEEFSDGILKVFKYILIITIIFLCLGGIAYFGHTCSECAINIIYIENGITIDAIEYQNNIYLKKGE